MARRLRLDPHDLAMLRESLSYMKRRIFDPADSQLLHRVMERVEEHVLAGETAETKELALEEGEARVAGTALRSYAEVLSHPGSEASNRRRVAHIKQLAGALEPGTGVLSGLWRWLKGQFRWLPGPGRPG